MKLAGRAILPGPPDKAWEMLNDPARLAKLLPGCERLEPDGKDRYKAVVKFGIAAITGKYAATLEFAEKKPPHSMHLKLSGKGVPGFVDGVGRVKLMKKGNDTEVRYSGEAQVGGAIAAVGQRLIDATARKIVNQFFTAAAGELKGQ